MTPEWIQRLNKRPEGEPPLLYQPIESVDWEAQQPCVERWAMIKKTIDLSKRGTIVDLGCHTGWFCRQFAKAGWTAIGIDHNMLYLDAADRILLWGAPLPVYRCGDLTACEIPQADVALALSVLMYLFPDHGWNFLKRVSEASPILFVDFGGASAGSLPFSEEQFPVELVRHTAYTRCWTVGRTDFESRPFFMCQR